MIQIQQRWKYLVLGPLPDFDILSKNCGCSKDFLQLSASALAIMDSKWSYVTKTENMSPLSDRENWDLYEMKFRRPWTSTVWLWPLQTKASLTTAWLLPTGWLRSFDAWLLTMVHLKYLSHKSRIWKMLKTYLRHPSLKFMLTFLDKILIRHRKNCCPMSLLIVR